MKSLVFVFAGVSLISTSAAAAPNNQSEPVALHTHRDVVVEVGADEARIISPDTAFAEGYRTLFVNRCLGGLTITRGFNDSRQNTSSIIDQTRTFAAYPYGDASWNQVMGHVRQILAPFDIIVTDVDPGNEPHTEIVTCGQSFRGQNVLGVAPFGCGVVANAIGYTFAENHANDPRAIAETIAHEAGHTFTLNHLYDCEDPMTYLNGCGDKYFVDSALQCAGVGGNNNWEVQACSCGGSTQNAYATLTSIFGPAVPTPPEVMITAPLWGAKVNPAFPIRVTANDNNGVAEVALTINATYISSVTAEPYVFNAPANLADGEHIILIEVTDSLGASSSQEITVCLGDDCPNAGVVPGTIGTSCNIDSQCMGNICARDSDNNGICTETCEPESTTCPSGFSCTATGASNVCWPVATESGGCAASGGHSAPWSGFFLLLGCIALWRRRRFQ